MRTALEERAMNDVHAGRGGRRLTDAELLEQRALIDAELQARESERLRAEREAKEAERERARAARTRARQALPSVGKWVQYERTCCGKEKCKVCGGDALRSRPVLVSLLPPRRRPSDEPLRGARS